ncbi:DUF2788 domain-containing protein [Sulfuriflexus mobilis]|uniref:DUF2788 domain-containing protein n=1 Tax=Sulfuriflexus mobilis TaxID=1811807 RepID=UPI000F81620D|nr:DUF2788 domain-containing protein [Sulfuriflexus mobilis]
MSIEVFEEYALIICVGGLILYMLYIIYKLGEASKAGRYGFIILFIGLGLGFVGVIAKSILVELLGL